MIAVSVGSVLWVIGGLLLAVVLWKFGFGMLAGAVAAAGRRRPSPASSAR